MNHLRNRYRGLLGLLNPSPRSVMVILMSEKTVFSSMLPKSQLIHISSDLFQSKEEKVHGSLFFFRFVNSKEFSSHSKIMISVGVPGVVQFGVCESRRSSSCLSKFFRVKFNILFLNYGFLFSYRFREELLSCILSMTLNSREFNRLYIMVSGK